MSKLKLRPLKGLYYIEKYNNVYVYLDTLQEESVYCGCKMTIINRKYIIINNLSIDYKNIIDHRLKHNKYWGKIENS